MDYVLQIAYVFVYVLIFAIFARSLISWFPIDREGFVVQALDMLTEPILMPLRRVIPLIGMVDLTPMIAILVLSFVLSALGAAR
ncbi:MAG: YggT family protein [Dehalococcoidia bacterium]